MAPAAPHFQPSVAAVAPHSLLVTSLRASCPCNAAPEGEGPVCVHTEPRPPPLEGGNGVPRRTQDNLEAGLRREAELELDVCGTWINRKGKEFSSRMFCLLGRLGGLDG